MEFSFVKNSYIAFKTPYKIQQIADITSLNVLIKNFNLKYENITISNDTYIVPTLLREYPSEAIKFSDKWINLQGDLVNRPPVNKIQVVLAKDPNALVIRGITMPNISTLLVANNIELPAINFNFILDFDNNQIVAKYDKLTA